ncbi:MAG: sigma-70 family RNA polymerase sigma factor, partial [Acidobacteria bacterium]|nr:sigma-70 family RNA polymerase sigma factor [Acidobacteriota bacterium]
SVVADSIERLLGRASNSRSLSASDLAVRVQLVLGKYLFRDNAEPQHTEIKAFIDEIRSDDLCLVIACERGDEKAWEDLVANFDSTVKSAARKISLNNDDAEDLASSIWAELYGLRQDADGNKKSKLAYYSGRGSLAGWLRAVVSQLAVDQFRKQSKFVQIEENREFENLANEAAENSNNHHVVSHADNPEEVLSAKQTAGDVSAALKAAVEMLEAEDKLIMKLYYFDNLKLKDIAAMFGYHEATASRKLVRVQSEIRKSVEKNLREHHGWAESEVKRYLSETATKLGLSVERLFAVLLAAAVMQDFFN